MQLVQRSKWLFALLSGLAKLRKKAIVESGQAMGVVYLVVKSI